MNAHKRRESAHHAYYATFDILRVICVVLITVIEFRLYFVPYYGFIEPLLFFSHGTLFTAYGYLVLRDGADLRKNIRHALKVFAIMFAVYGALTVGYYYGMTGNPLAMCTKRNLFNFVVLNIWPSSIGASIWWVQSTLYALIIFWIFRKLKKFDWLFCIILFVISILLGEFADLIHFNFLGYSFIPGNFLTRAMPYMLLGRLLHKHYKKITTKMRLSSTAYFFIGLGLSALEFLILGISGHLIYANHFIGFIVMSAAACLFCASHPTKGKMRIFGRYASTVYKGLFYVFNPLGYILLFAASLLCQTESQYVICQYSVGPVVFFLVTDVFLFVAYLKNRIQGEDENQVEAEAAVNEAKV